MARGFGTQTTKTRKRRQPKKTKTRDSDEESEAEETDASDSEGVAEPASKKARVGARAAASAKRTPGIVADEDSLAPRLAQ